MQCGKRVLLSYKCKPRYTLPAAFTHYFIYWQLKSTSLKEDEIIQVGRSRRGIKYMSSTKWVWLHSVSNGNKSCWELEGWDCTGVFFNPHQPRPNERKLSTTLTKQIGQVQIKWECTSVDDSRQERERVSGQMRARVWTLVNSCLHLIWALCYHVINFTVILRMWLLP